MQKTKVLVLAIDSATFDFIYPLAGKNALPNLGRLLENGAHAGLNSTIPAHSAPAWITFMTGLNPGKHGVLAFTEMDLSQYSAARDKLINSSYYRGGTIFDYLSRQNRRVISLGITTTYPPWPINGIMRSGNPTPDERRAFTYPENYAERFGQLLTMKNDKKAAADFDVQVKEYEYENQRITDGALDLIKNEEWDFFVYFTGILDAVQHTFWQFKHTDCPIYDNKLADKYRNVIENMYKAVDYSIGRLLKEIDENTYILVVSDHGSGARPLKTVNFNHWLYQAGFLEPAGKLKGGLSSAAQKGIEYLKAKLPIRNIYRRMFPDKMRGVVANIRSNTSAISWEKTKAYRVEMLYPYEGIHLNVKGRQPEGIIERGAEYEKLRDEIIAAIKTLCDPASKEKIVSEVYKKEDIYSGTHLDNLPDIVVKFNLKYEGGAGIDTLITDSPAAAFRKWSGYHLPEGIFIVSGPGIKQKKKLAALSMQDIAPTVLYLMGEAIPQNMDGRACLEIFDAKMPEPRFCDEGLKVNGQKEQLSTGDEERARALRALGYME
ncbi:MAG: alkaline phosphatase family protein [Candidatus Schekmanbacteria bacterium]|nr:alkaline phosphatase family protein [Candidatus Schekmanbacteria bacterium]